MGGFFACFRIKNCERQKAHLVSRSIAPKNRDVLVTKNQLASVFLCEEKGSPSEQARHLSLQQNFDRDSADEELKDEVKFLKSCGALLETPVEIRKASEKAIVQTPSNDGVPSNFHSSIRKLYWDEQLDQLSNNAAKVQGNLDLSETKPESSFCEDHQTQRKVRFDEGVGHTPGNELVDSVKLNVTPQSEDQIQQLGTDDSSYPTPLSLSEDMKSPGTVFTPKSTGRIRNQYVYSVLNPVQNLSQWKALSEGALLGQSSDCFDQQMDSSIQDGEKSQQTLVNPLSTDVYPYDKRSQDQHTIFKEEVDYNQETPKLVVSSLSQWLKPPPTNEERWKAKNTARERSPSNKSPDTDRPIIGIVAAHWNNNAPQHVSPKWFDGNGIPNSTNKYKEDQKVSWHATPFEERLEKALSDEKLYPRRELNGRPVNLEEKTSQSPSSPASLQQSSTLINSLISSSYAFRSFSGKWQSIRDKLEKLNCGMTSCDGGSEGITQLDVLLQALTATVKQTQLLADQYSSESYTGGKLRLRSDLDMVISKLDLHIRQLDEIYASGILTHSRAIILSRPGPGATRGDMRLYAKDVFSRLRIGGPELRARALAALSEILSEDENYVKIVATEIDDGISYLLSLVEFGDVGTQEEASEAISVIAGFESYRGVLAMAGVIRPLIRVLEMGSDLGKERVGHALKKMTENSDNSWSVSAQGGVSTLLKICSSCNCSKELIGIACGVLRNISGVDEIKRFIVDEGAVSVFAKLVKSKEEVIQVHAIEFLAALATEDEAMKQRLIRERFIESLVHVLQPNSAYSSKAREVALRAIETCFFLSTNFVNVLMGSGYVNNLLFFLRNGEISVQESALKAMSRLCGVSEEARRVMGDLGFMPELVKLLETRSFDVREMAAETLCSLISIQRNRRKFIQEDYNVNRILQLLNPEEEKPVATKKLLLSALLALTDSNSGRRKIVASGYVKNVEKLAENNVIEAKKIVKKLSANRFRAILSGIWSS